MRGVLKSIEILEAPSLAKLIKRRALPELGVEKDMDALRHYVRQTAKTVFHPVGTAKMGAGYRPDGRGRCRTARAGREGLRVADASVMPTLVSGNTNAPTMMIAERCARFITQRSKAMAA